MKAIVIGMLIMASGMQANTNLSGSRSGKGTLIRSWGDREVRCKVELKIKLHDSKLDIRTQKECGEEKSQNHETFFVSGKHILTVLNGRVVGVIDKAPLFGHFEIVDNVRGVERIRRLVLASEENRATYFELSRDIYPDLSTQRSTEVLGVLLENNER